MGTFPDVFLGQAPEKNSWPPLTEVDLQVRHFSSRCLIRSARAPCSGTRFMLTVGAASQKPAHFLGDASSFSWFCHGLGHLTRNIIKVKSTMRQRHYTTHCSVQLNSVGSLSESEVLQDLVLRDDRERGAYA